MDATRMEARGRRGVKAVPVMSADALRAEQRFKRAKPSTRADSDALHFETNLKPATAEAESARAGAPRAAAEPVRVGERAGPPHRPTQGTALGLGDVEPCAGVVDGPAVFAEVVAVLERYMVLPVHAADTVALWVALTYLAGVIDVLPRLWFTSPTKACGKTRLLGLLAALVRRALFASSITPSATFRAIESGEPTLLLDEMDNARLDENGELRAVLNSGHTRAGAWTVRNVGEQHEPKRFSTWAPVALACIGELPDTVASRCVRITMKRRTRAERVERMRESRIGTELEPLRARLARWCQDQAELIRDADPQVPEALEDRAADNWGPLLAIADAIGGDWPERARLAAKASCGGADDEAPGIQLLGDLRDLFAEHGADELSSDAIERALEKLEGRPWPEWQHGKPITKRGVARLLSPFGARSRNLRLPGGKVVKGYVRTDLEDAFARYLPPSNRYNATGRDPRGSDQLFASATAAGCSASENAVSPAPDAACSAVADKKPVDGQAGMTRELVAAMMAPFGWEPAPEMDREPDHA